MTATENDSVQQVPDKETASLTSAGPVRLAWRATWLDQRAFHAVGVDSDPLRRGLVALLIALAITAVARFIGIGLGILTSPKIGIIQDQIYAAITTTAYFENLAAQTPDFAQQFETTYAALWEAVRFLGGYPSLTGLGSSLISLLSVLGSWLTFTSLAYLAARWLGAPAGFGRALGIFALAYAPVMVTVVEAVPGANAAWTLVFLLVFVAKFIAAREAFKFQPGKSLSVILLPYVAGIVVVFTLLIFSAALGLSRIPYLDDLLRMLRFAGIFAR